MREDLVVGPEKALEDLDALRKSILRTGGARLFLVGSRPAQEKLQPALASLLSTLAPSPALTTAALPPPPPGFVGLLAPNMAGGVIINSAAGADYADTGREAILDYLASLQFSGSGAHSAFMRTWGAGLAYSNGIRNSPANGRLGYYAERTPELPQTLKFVVDLVRESKFDPGLGEYAVAQAFSSRAADAYERRAEAMAEDLADGSGPEVVARFRKTELDVRRMPSLDEELHARRARVLGKVLPGLDESVKNAKAGLYFVIGPERQLSLYEQYLKTVEGPDARLERLYPRDFWIGTATAAAASGGGSAR
jgi:hypothetical protein